MASGLTVKAACEELGLSPTRYYEWMKGDEDFGRLLANTKDQVMDALVVEAVTRAKQRLRSLGPKAIGVIAEALDSTDPGLQMRATRVVLRHIQEFQTKDTLQVEPEGFAELMQEADGGHGRPLTD